MDEGNLYRSDLKQYAEEIATAIEREECAGEEVRGLIDKYGDKENVNRYICNEW